MRIALIGCLIAAPVFAADPRPAPEYFLRTVMAATTAQQLAVSCAKLSFNITAASEKSGEVIKQLQADGFSPDQLESQMIDPSDEFARRQSDFMARHGLVAAPDETKVCAAGLQEIADRSDIGAFLTEVSQ